MKYCRASGCASSDQPKHGIGYFLLAFVRLYRGQSLLPIQLQSIAYTVDSIIAAEEGLAAVVAALKYPFFYFPVILHLFLCS